MGAGAQVTGGQASVRVVGLRAADRRAPAHSRGEG